MSETVHASMPRRCSFPSRRPNYWWNDELTVLRLACHRARRAARRAVGRVDHRQKECAYKTARKTLKLVIQRSKRKCFKELCGRNPWGNAYRIVMGRFRGCSSPQITCPTLLLKIIQGLLPQQEESTDTFQPDRQYRFRKARSTIDAIKLVTGLAEDAIHRKGSTGKYCVVVTLDVKNAFNSANWNLIRKSLAKVGFPA